VTSVRRDLWLDTAVAIVAISALFLLQWRQGENKKGRKSNAVMT
jgi:hypothetical protein